METTNIFPFKPIDGKSAHQFLAENYQSVAEAARAVDDRTLESSLRYIFSEAGLCGENQNAAVKVVEEIFARHRNQKFWNQWTTPADYKNTILVLLTEICLLTCYLYQPLDDGGGSRKAA